MKCTDIQLIIDEVGDMDRLPPAASRHVGQCPACDRFGRDLAALRALLREPGRVTAPPDFDVRLAARLREARRPAASPGWAWEYRRPLAAAASFVILLSGAVAISQLTPEEAGRDAAVGVQPGPAVAGTAPTPAQPQPLPTPVPPDGPHVATAATPPRSSAPRPPRAAAPRAVAHREARPARESEEVTIFVRDMAGSRVVSVPEVLVGAQEIVTPVGAPLLETAEARARASF
jgi:hypothetical protein